MNRFCSTGLQTIAIAAQQIMSGQNRTVVAGGLESISLVQNEHADAYIAEDTWIAECKPELFMSMLKTAEVRRRPVRDRTARHTTPSHSRASSARRRRSRQDAWTR